MTDPILSKIHKQKAASVLYALKVLLDRDGKWDEEKYGKAFAEKMKRLEERWK